MASMARPAPSPALKLGMLAKQKLLSGQEEADVSRKPARQPHEMEPNVTGSLSNLMLRQLQVRGLGAAWPKKSNCSCG
eukprot:1159798-Pelagomonas_calceolata.AAC.11